MTVRDPLLFTRGWTDPRQIPRRLGFAGVIFGLKRPLTPDIPIDSCSWGAVWSNYCTTE